MKVLPDVGASLAAAFANEAGLDIGEPDVIRPAISASRIVVRPPAPPKIGGSTYLCVPKTSSELMP
jgi:hypothetical protein